MRKIDCSFASRNLLNISKARKFVTGSEVKVLFLRVGRTAGIRRLFAVSDIAERSATISRDTRVVPRRSYVYRAPRESQWTLSQSLCAAETASRVFTARTPTRSMQHLRVRRRAGMARSRYRVTKNLDDPLTRRGRRHVRSSLATARQSGKHEISSCSRGRTSRQRLYTEIRDSERD